MARGSLYLPTFLYSVQNSPSVASSEPSLPSGKILRSKYYRSAKLRVSISPVLFIPSNCLQQIVASTDTRSELSLISQFIPNLSSRQTASPLHFRWSNIPDLDSILPEHLTSGGRM